MDYTHNFVTTERRVRQLLYDGGFEIAATVRSIGAATGLRRDALAAGALLVNLPGVDAVSRWTRTEELLFRVRKNLFETHAARPQRAKPLGDERARRVDPSHVAVRRRSRLPEGACLLLGHRLAFVARRPAAADAVAVSGSIVLRRSPVVPPFVVHVKPVGVPHPDHGARHVAALVLIVEPGRASLASIPTWWPRPWN